MKRRTLLVLVTCLLVGALLNVGVAWITGCFVQYKDAVGSSTAMTDDPVRIDPYTGDRVGPPGVSALLYRGLGAEYIVVTVVEWTRVDDPVVRPPMSRLWPRWGPLSRRTPRDVFENPPRNQRLGYAARGWPMRSMWCELEQGTHGPLRGGIPMGQSHTPNTFIVTQHILPLFPAWPGFTLNTLFYAGLLWLIVAAPGAARRRWRTRRGRCAACGYPIGPGAICSECGTPTPRSRITAD